MKKEDVPQDLSSLGRITKEVCYATDKTGKYLTELSQGWNIKTMALEAAWSDQDEAELSQSCLVDLELEQLDPP